MKFPDPLWIALIVATALSCPLARAGDPVSSGTITNPRRATLDLRPDPAHPSYQRQVKDLIGKEWPQMLKPHVGEFAGKLTRIHIVIAPTGKVDSLKVIRSDDDQLAELSKQAIQACHFPPIPPESASELKEGHFEMDLDFIVY